MEKPPPTISRWLDLDSPEFKSIEDYTMSRRSTLRAIEVGAIIPDKNGNLYTENGIPVWDYVNGECVGVRISAKALN